MQGPASQQGMAHDVNCAIVQAIFSLILFSPTFSILNFGSVLQGIGGHEMMGAGGPSLSLHV
jgi:hypothetical protein